MASKAPSDIQFELKDSAQGLTYSATSVEYVFDDDPMPQGADDGRHTIIVDMSDRGDEPVGVCSLSSSLMVSGFNWEPQTDPALLAVECISLDSTEHVPHSQPMTPQQTFAAIQRDSHILSKRVALLKQALNNLDHT
ncbi:hypothetical protein GGH96_003193 [Coemansia sp. RSA 1972]|nr:hypothetical protein GGH96_003193 [Coemansia sp. RSA 1972]